SGCGVTVTKQRWLYGLAGGRASEFRALCTLRVGAVAEVGGRLGAGLALDAGASSFPPEGFAPKSVFWSPHLPPASRRRRHVAVAVVPQPRAVLSGRAECRPRRRVGAGGEGREARPARRRHPVRQQELLLAELHRQRRLADGEGAEEGRLRL